MSIFKIERELLSISQYINENVLKLFIQIHNGTQGAYIDPDAPVHITTGSAVSKIL